MNTQMYRGKRFNKEKNTDTKSLWMSIITKTNSNSKLDQVKTADVELHKEEFSLGKIQKTLILSYNMFYSWGLT